MILLGDYILNPEKIMGFMIDHDSSGYYIQVIEPGDDHFIAVHSKDETEIRNIWDKLKADLTHTYTVSK